MARNRAKRVAKELFKKFKENFSNKDVVLIIKKFDAENKVFWKQRLNAAYLWLEHVTFLDN